MAASACRFETGVMGMTACADFFWCRVTHASGIVGTVGVVIFVLAVTDFANTVRIGM